VKTVILTIAIFFGLTASAAQIVTVHKDGAREPGIQEPGFSRETPKLCFKGKTSEICKDLRRAVASTNVELGSSGSDERLRYIACAQSQNYAMLSYALEVMAPKAHEKAIELRKTVYVRECS
jgi:hypothetical protein